MVRFLLRTSGPLAALRVMVRPARPPAKTIWSPLWAAAISPRSEPSPLAPVSPRLVTVRVLSRLRVSRASRVGRSRALRAIVRGLGRWPRRASQRAQLLSNDMPGLLDRRALGGNPTVARERSPTRATVPGPWGWVQKQAKGQREAHRSSGRENGGVHLAAA